MITADQFAALPATLPLTITVSVSANCARSFRSFLSHLSHQKANSKITISRNIVAAKIPRICNNIFAIIALSFNTLFVIYGRSFRGAKYFNMKIKLFRL